MEAIKTNDDLAVALALSYDHPVAILKASNTCPLSRRVFDEFKMLEDSAPELGEKIFVLVVQQAREVSDAIAMRFGVIHESPQVLVVENEDVIYYESHEAINVQKVAKLLRGEGARKEGVEVEGLEGLESGDIQ